MSRIKQLFPNVHTISIIDDAFTTNLKHAKTFLKKYIEDQYPFKVTIFNVRADHIDQELLLLFQAVKLETLAIGIESGDESVFKLVNKGEKLTKIKETILHLQEVGFTPWLNMVIGLPGDSLQCHARSMDWVTDIPGKKIVQWLHYAPFRNTWAYEYFVKEGSIHDGFIPPLMSGRYDKLPEEGHFNARAFSKKEKLLAQLEAYLRTLAPILILNEAKVKQLCEENNLMALYDEWKKKAPIEDFFKKKIPAKIEKGQISDWALIKN